MHSLLELFRIGAGPSSSHTLGPQRAAALLLERCPGLARARVTLYGSLAATGRGHLTDRALEQSFAPRPVEVVFRPEVVLALHPNGLDLEAFDAGGLSLGALRAYSVGGGAIAVEGQPEAERASVYDRDRMASILAWSAETGRPLWQYAEEREGEALRGHLARAWAAMREAIDRGLHAEGVLPGPLHLPRKARSFLLKARRCREPFQRGGLLSAYALAVSEENAAGGAVVTAPTCGSSGVVPAVLRYLQEALEVSDLEVARALATAGLFGNVVKTCASISGAEVGCQGEVGTACAMAAAGAAQLLGATPHQIEYAAEMGLEHHLGLTCDPIAGLVQIPCIERNAFAATRALDCADYALLSDGNHLVSFDEVTLALKQTGRDLMAAYRETALGGLAAVHK
jgi:L-serine dehydratase